LITLLYILASTPLLAVSHIAAFVHTDAVDQHRQYCVGIPLQTPQTPQASDSALKERASGIKRMAENQIPDHVGRPEGAHGSDDIRAV
jgi:hypothetical protein